MYVSNDSSNKITATEIPKSFEHYQTGRSSEQKNELFVNES